MVSFQIKLYLYIILFFTFFLNTNGFAQIIINSVLIEESTCSNNGSITIYAQPVPNKTFLYSMVEGPYYHPPQTSNAFHSLPPGNYKVKISDGNGSDITENFTVPGNYQNIEFNPVSSDPLCSTTNDGYIIENLNPATGKAPFTWEVTYPSNETIGPLTSDTFKNLSNGNYTIKITDACGNYSTKVSTLDGRDYPLIVAPTTVEIIGCDSAIVNLSMYTEQYRFPMTIQFETSSGIFTSSTFTRIDTSDRGSMNGAKHLMISQIIPNLSYYQKFKYTATNACGNTISSTDGLVGAMSVCFINNNSVKNCKNEANVIFSSNQYGCIPSNQLFTALKGPVNYLITETESKIITHKGILYSDPDHDFSKSITGFSIEGLLPQKSYDLLLTDGCGKTFTSTVYLPDNPEFIPNVSTTIDQRGCIDSVAQVIIHARNFRSQPTMIMLTGPEKLGSTKNGYQYKADYIYPKTFTPNNFGSGSDVDISNYAFIIGNFGPGKYTYKMIDSCGNELFDSFEIKPQDVVDLKHELSVKRGCLGKNKLMYSFATSDATIVFHNVNNNDRWERYFTGPGSMFTHHTDSIENIPAGKYAVMLYHNSQNTLAANDTNIQCKIIHDTITIEDYKQPELITGNALKCRKKVYIHLLADSSKGVPPYKYEIIEGPEKFALQESEIFTFNTTGIYTARIIDVCGNATTKKISIDTISFKPVSENLNCNNTLIEYPEAEFYSYHWIKPNGSIYISNKLSVNPAFPEDTGTYKVLRISNLNGCIDTTIQYHVINSLKFSFQNNSICKGESYTFNNKTYSKTGIYYDTLVSKNGCDSIVRLDLKVLNYKSSEQIKYLCKGKTLKIGNQIINKSGTYYDTISTNSCDSIITYKILDDDSPAIDLGNDTSFCQGTKIKIFLPAGMQAYFWNDNFSDSTNNWYLLERKEKVWVETRNNKGCSSYDTLDVKEIYETPTVFAGKDVKVCKGDSVLLSATGARTYKWIPINKNNATVYVKPAISTKYTVLGYSENSCVSLPDEIMVEVLDVDSSLFENNSVFHCFKNSPIQIGPIKGDKFYWPVLKDSTRFISISQEGIYKVQVTFENGCKIEDEIVAQNLCSAKIFVPNAFTPNKDGLHDDFEIFTYNIESFELKIFNRWGEIIFISNNPNQRWDGKYLESDMPIGSYPWLINYSNSSEASQTMRGSVTIVR